MAPFCAAAPLLTMLVIIARGSLLAMRIALDLRFVNDHFPGIGRYVFSLASALVSLDAPHEFVFLSTSDAPRRTHERPGSFAAANTRYDLGHLLRASQVRALAAPPPFSVAGQVALPALLRQARADLFHAPYYLFPYAGLPCPVVVTLYDIIPRLFPRESSLRARLFFDLSTRLALWSARRVITLSRCARDDIARVYRVSPARIDVVYSAADARFRPADPAIVAEVKTRYRLPERYILCVASDKPHKNVGTLVEAWRRSASGRCEAAPLLVLAGHRDRGVLSFDHPAIRDLGAVAEADLPALYSDALIFVYPSRYEGFGLPPLEAMACGAAVICSRAGSLPEVVGDAALLIDPDDPGALAAAIDRVLADTALRAALSDAGRRRAATFSWRRAAEETLKVYARAVR